MKRVKINSDRNCSHCLLFKNILKAQDGSSIISGTCIKEHNTNLIIYHGVLCEDIQIDPKNPLPRRLLTKENKEARKYLKGRRSKTPTSIKVKRQKEYPNPKIKSPLIKSKKKQAILSNILSDNIEVKKLTDKLFSLPKRSCKEGKKIRKELRKLGFFLSKRGE